MTGRQLIEAICVNFENLDSEIRIEILHRNEHSLVARRQNATEWRVAINRVAIEAGGLRDAPVD